MLQEALHSETFGELEELVNRSGPEMTPEVMDCLLRLPPLDDPGRDTPAARCGAVLGWEWGTDIPAYEEDHLAQFVQNIEEYSFTDFPGETGRRVVGAVVLGYMGYYLSRAAEDQRRSAETPVDRDIREDYQEWMQSFIPEGLPEDVKP